MDVDEAQQFATSGLDATRFKLVRNVNDIDKDEDYFAPDMCHQVFGENETIFGYKNLKIRILYDALTFQCYVYFNYDSMIEPDADANISAENVMEKLNPWLPADYFIKRNDFVKCITENNKPGPFGKCVGSFKTNHREYEIFVCNSKTPGYADFHQRMETVIVWFIDAANFIDIDDEKWVFFVLYEKIEKQSSTLYYPIGYSTVYKYYAYPESRRYRISQFIIFPPYQNFGLGTELLKGVYEHLSAFENIYDITVEDPSEKFQMLRDYLDAISCMTLPTFSPKIIKGDFSKEMIKDARTKFKINEKQCRRIYEIIRLLHTNVDDLNDYRSYKLMVKKRLNAPFKRQQEQNKKVRKFLKEAPYLQYDHNLKSLEKDFEQLIRQYNHVIRRLKH